MLAANLSPKDIFLATKDNVSIITKKGTKAKGLPCGTNNAKNLILCIVTPKTTVPNTTEKLHENANKK